MPERSELPPDDLGDIEMEVLTLMWELGKASVSEIHERIMSARPLAYTTVMTVMRKLADKGYLGFTRRGNAYVYHVVATEHSVRARLLKRLLKRAFSGSPLALVQTLVSEEALTPDEIREMDRLIDKLRDREAKR